jgi:hypothetical protein
VAVGAYFCNESRAIWIAARFLQGSLRNRKISGSSQAAHVGQAR